MCVKLSRKIANKNAIKKLQKIYMVTEQIFLLQIPNKISRSN